MYTSLDIKCKVGNYFDFKSKKESYTFICYLLTFFVLDADITAWANALTANTADASGTVATAVVEGSSTGTTLFTAVATGSGTVTYAFTGDGNPGSVASPTITAGAVTLAGTLDYEKAHSLVFKIV